MTLSVNSSGERGLLGVAFDPNFASNQFIYVFYTATTPAVHNRISRFKANGDVVDTSVAEVVLLDFDNLSGATNHNGGAMHFGLDGKLYAAHGDNANGNNSQTLGNLLGKVIRMNPVPDSTAQIPADNPFFATATGKNRLIWTLGLRNPFTFNIQPGTGLTDVNDVGEVTWEEINDARGTQFRMADDRRAIQMRRRSLSSPTRRSPIGIARGYRPVVPSPAVPSTIHPPRARYSAGTASSFSGSASDPEDGTLPPSALAWRIDFHHDTHTHPAMLNTTGIASGTFPIPNSGETSANVWYRVYLTATDSAPIDDGIRRRAAHHRHTHTDDASGRPPGDARRSTHCDTGQHDQRRRDASHAGSGLAADSRKRRISVHELVGRRNREPHDHHSRHQHDVHGDVRIGAFAPTKCPHCPIARLQLVSW